MTQKDRKTAPPEWPVFELKLIGVTGFIMHNFGNYKERGHGCGALSAPVTSGGPSK